MRGKDFQSKPGHAEIELQAVWHKKNDKKTKQNFALLSRIGNSRSADSEESRSSGHSGEMELTAYSRWGWKRVGTRTAVLPPLALLHHARLASYKSNSSLQGLGSSPSRCCRVRPAGAKQQYLLHASRPANAAQFLWRRAN